MAGHLIMNCHGCKWLDRYKKDGNGYCCRVVRSQTQSSKVRRPDMDAASCTSSAIGKLAGKLNASRMFERSSQMDICEYPVTDGYTLRGKKYEIRHRSIRAVVAGAAPYAVYIDGEFYATCETMQEATEEIHAIEQDELSERRRLY